MSDKENWRKYSEDNKRLGLIGFFGHPEIGKVLGPQKRTNIQEVAQKAGDILDRDVTTAISLSANP